MGLHFDLGKRAAPEEPNGCHVESPSETSADEQQASGQATIEACAARILMEFNKKSIMEKKHIAEMQAIHAVSPSRQQSLAEGMDSAHDCQ